MVGNVLGADGVSKAFETHFGVLTTWDLVIFACTIGYSFTVGSDGMFLVMLLVRV